MNETNALDEILRAAYGDDVIKDVPVIIHGDAVVTMDDGTRVRLTAEVI